ncbi:extracellular catalytic domain type 1 short-chain-length polyhydroxyalkanoate depolymerase [Pseudoduganella sp. OTU4001]|uniref:extracellular catalytic domain type 1 short-chain-length polyhydroxyalkanoate depolymerase n=1 Tax=Pseudoduganella sp. OTU4001 TaxID=3043854 RepID=UPI00313DFCAC
MKPFEQFLGKMMEAARLTQAQDPHSANEVIQNALKAAGLLPAQGGVDPGYAPGLTPTMAPGARPTRKPTPMRKRQTAPVRDPRAPGEFLPGSFTGIAGTRQYKLYVPSTAPTGPRPLIVMLHGCTQNSDDFAAGTAMNAVAEQHGCLVLYPEQSRGANPTLCWNWFEAVHQERGEGEPDLIAGMTQQIVDEWQADERRVYVAGLSAGGAMAAIMAAAYPDMYAAVGVHSGLPVGKARDLITGLAAMKKAPRAGRKTNGRVRQRVPVIVFHGDCDEVVHAGNGEAVLEQFLCPPLSGEALRRTKERTVNAGGRAYTKMVMMDANGRSVAEHWSLHGAGHAWSGGSAAGSYTDPNGPDASAEMVRFFLAQAD